MILDYNEDGTSFTDIFGITFQAPQNPLIDELQSASDSNKTQVMPNTPKFIELIPNGDEIQVTRANRKEFVNLFVQHTLYKSCEASIEKFLSGLRTILYNQVLSICTSTEVILNKIHFFFKFIFPLIVFFRLKQLFVVLLIYLI